MAPDPRPETGKDASENRPRVSPITALYELLSDTSFALFVIIALAVASILGILITDQIPLRGEMARLRYPDRAGDPLVWILIHVVPEHPFRCLVFRTLLALLSLSLFACVIKRWRRQWRLAFTLPDPVAGEFDGPRAVGWRTAVEPAPAAIESMLRRRGFALRRAESGGAWFIGGSRFGIARLGSVFTHVGFLCLVIGGLVMASSGTSGTAWLSAGESAWIPGTDARIVLDDFRIELAPDGQVADYVSSVRLMRDDTLLRSAEIEVNRPLRYRGRSIYQSSYRGDPTRVRSLMLTYDMPAPGTVWDPERGDAPRAGAAEAADAADASPPHHPAGTRPGAPEGMMKPPHEPVRGTFQNPTGITLHPGQRVALAGTPYSVEIDTFLADFRVEAGTFHLGSDEPRNPAVRINFFLGDAPAGSSWYFLLHPEMPVGAGPDLPVRFSDYDPFMQTGLDIATHPGSAWVWVGFAVMTLGTLLSFTLRHERVWLRVRRPDEARGEWELALVHAGATPQDRGEGDRPARDSRAAVLPARSAGGPGQRAWDAGVTDLGASLLKHWPPA